jgi:hypothetical protein
MMRYNVKIFDISEDTTQIIDKYAKFLRRVSGKSNKHRLWRHPDIEKIGELHQEKLCKKVTKEDMIRFFGDTDQIHSLRTQDFYATILIQFYRWMAI